MSGTLPPLKRHRGQHLLIDKNVLGKIIKAADIKSDETIVEIGAGTGILTRELARKAKRVIAVELDKELELLLRANLSEYANVDIIQDDCRDIPLSRYGRTDGDYAVVANIPYNITSRLIRIFLEGFPRPSRMILLIQKEVAQRMIAKPPAMNLLAVCVQAHARVRMLFTVSRHCFKPSPKVESAVVRIEPFILERGSLENERRFFTAISACYKGKRKKITTTLSAHLGIEKEKIELTLKQLLLSPSARPQELSVDQWRMLLSPVFSKESIVYLQ